MSTATLDALQARLGHVFRDGSLLVRALTHRSHGADHNERLEFLGDAVLNLAVSDLLFDHFDDSPEGDLTRVRAHLVREDSLHRLALTLSLPDVLRLSNSKIGIALAKERGAAIDAITVVRAPGASTDALKLLQQPGFYQQLEEKSAYLATGIAKAAKDAILGSK